jgi:hypothetical protein
MIRQRNESDSEMMMQLIASTFKGAGRGARLAAILAALASLSLAGCSLERIGANDDDPAPAPTRTGALPPAVMPPGGPPIEMSGRWVLASTGRPSCALVFNSSVGAHEGTVAADAACPGKFVMSRKWAFEQNALIIRNVNGEPLARLSSAEPGKLEGQTTGGEPVSLTR